MASNALDLGSLFSAVTKNLTANQDVLNQADTYNNDHGTHIVDIFKTITRSVKANKNATPAEQLAHASATVKATQPSGSGKFYADSLATAAQQLTGKNLDASTAMTLVTALLGGTQQAPAKTAQSGAGDLLGALLGGSGQSQSQSGTGDLLGSLLGGLTGQQSGQSSQTDGKVDINDLMTAGMSFMQSKSRGASNTEAIVSAILAASPLGTSQDRAMSGNIIASTLLKKLSSGLGAAK